MLDYRTRPEGVVLRRRLRELVAAEVPRGYLGAFTDDPADLEVAQRFCARMGRERMLTMAWPEEYGGANASAWQQTIVREEMWAMHEPRGAQYMGVNWVGPALMRYGTEAQREQHLPAIATGEAIWCQGFSEPNSGSDLASLRTAATATDDGWSITGEKIWTSYARMAQWCFLLARTDSTGPKQSGITVFLLPMDRPGITATGITSMLGNHHLNEVHFDQVHAGPDDVLGQVGAGWHIVREVLALERVGIARYARCDRLLSWAPQAIGSRWPDLPAALRQRWAMALARTRAVRVIAYRIVSLQDAGDLDPASAATYRIAAATLDQHVAEVLMDIAGSAAIGATEESSRFEAAVEDHWRYAQAATVAGGTLEMQRLLVARSMTGAAR